MELMFEILNAAMISAGLLMLSVPVFKAIHDAATGGAQQTQELVKVHDDGR